MSEQQRKIDFEGLRMVGRAVEEAPGNALLPNSSIGESVDFERTAANLNITLQQAEYLFGKCGDKADFLTRLRQFILDHEPKPTPAPGETPPGEGPHHEAYLPCPPRKRRRPFGGATLHEFTFMIERGVDAHGEGEAYEIPLQVTYTHYQGRNDTDDPSEATIQYARDAEGKDWYPLLSAEEDMRMQEKAWEDAAGQGGNYDEHDPDDRVEHAERFDMCS